MGCPISKHIIGNWYNSHTCSLACGINAMIVRKVKWKSLKLPTPLLVKMVNKNNIVFQKE